jgi:sulfatase maturation enzyme AslB (radical SAM superfamily)
MEKEIKIPESYKYISAFLTMRCPLSCSYCLNDFDKNLDRRKFKEISGEQWVESLNKLNSRPEVPVTFSGGEPFMHKDFISIINNLKNDLNIDILTTTYWGTKGIERFIQEVSPERVKRKALYPSIRVSYHPEQMGDGRVILENVKKLQEAGFSIGIYSVQYPSPENLEAITSMQFRCKAERIDFRLKDFTGKYEGKDDLGRPFSITHGDYSKHPNSTFLEETKDCLCKTSELLIGPDGRAYRCHRDLYAEEFSIGSLLDKDLTVQDEFMQCSKYGQCHPCDVKAKTNNRQELGHTSVDITFP